MEDRDVVDILATRLKHRRAQILTLLQIDRRIGADPYDDVARLKEVDRVLGWITELRSP